MLDGKIKDDIERREATPHFSDYDRYESGQMDEEEMTEFFQKLVDTGLAWRLQGSYGRTAVDLIRAGLVHAEIDFIH